MSWDCKLAGCKVLIFFTQVYIPKTFKGGYEILSKPKRFYKCFCIKINRCHLVMPLTFVQVVRQSITLSLSLSRGELMSVSMASHVKLPVVLCGLCLVTCCWPGQSSSTRFRFKPG